MWMTELPPFVPFFVAGMLAIVIRGHARQVLMLLVPVIGGVHLLTVEPGGIGFSLSVRYEHFGLA